VYFQYFIEHKEHNNRKQIAREYKFQSCTCIGYKNVRKAKNVSYGAGDKRQLSLPFPLIHVLKFRNVGLKRIGKCRYESKERYTGKKLRAVRKNAFA
jgi:hypothetical protein